MKTLTWLGMWVVALFTTIAAAQGFVNESNVNVGNGVVGTLARPAEVTGDAPAVLLLHGFASSKDEVGDMYTRLAQSLAVAGITSLRIDFRGGGDSSGDFADTTVISQVEDAMQGLEYLQAQEGIDPSRTGVLGFSLGAGVAITLAGDHADAIKSLAVWSSIGSFTDMNASLGAENVATAQNEGSVTVDLGFRTVTLKNTFFESLDSYDVMAQLAKYPGAFLAVGGGQDELARYLPQLGETATGSPKETILFPDSDHIYHVLTEDQTDADAVIRETTEWFKATL
ncbi:alpha/beta fold hydrolase [soil metagenome]